MYDFDGLDKIIQIRDGSVLSLKVNLRDILGEDHHEQMMKCAWYIGSLCGFQAMFRSLRPGETREHLLIKFQKCLKTHTWFPTPSFRHEGGLYLCHTGPNSSNKLQNLILVEHGVMGHLSSALCRLGFLSAASV